jgi:hypothetical protein
MSADMAATRLGHADPAITLRVYVHVIRSAAISAVIFAHALNPIEDARHVLPLVSDLLVHRRREDHMGSAPWAEMVKAVPNLVVALLTLSLGWFVSNRITARWDERKKRRELDLIALGAFYEMPGAEPSTRPP